MKTTTLITAFTLLLASSSAFSWGQTGHRVTGAIAEHYLTEKAKASINQLIPNETLAEASTYADEMRSNPSEFWQKTASPWHYTTVPKGKTYSQVGAPEFGDAVTALKAFRKTLLNEAAALADKQLALRFIVHLIGDLHQPLHVGNGQDRGGNDLKIKFFWEESNLHSVWDSGMIDRRQLSFTEWTTWLRSKITAAQTKQWTETDPLVWIAESQQIRETIYPRTEELSWDYLYDNLPIAIRRLQQSGVRIAAYLNAVFAASGESHPDKD